jgi:peptidoglycan-N-acetylglucosamine deacetylase
LKHFYTPPVLIKKLFNDFIWDSSAKILLTFDDGPQVETTEIILKSLSEKEIKAVFFCVGNNISNNPGLVNRILDEGHLIGNHTYNHKRLTQLNNHEAGEEIDSFNILMKEKFNYDVKYFRPPHGRFTISTSKVLKEKKLKCVMWSLLTYDYKNDFDVVKFAVSKYLKSDSIIVLHNSIKSKNIIKDSIDFIADEASNKGFSFGKPDECLSEE